MYLALLTIANTSGFKTCTPVPIAGKPASSQVSFES
jgi:hypothetical protein